MLTHYNPDTGLLTATCSNEELHCIRDANLSLDTERAKTGRDLLVELQRLKEERENLGDYVEVHVGLANVQLSDRLVGRCVTAAGMVGKCVWDDGGDSVVVEFDHEVPHNGFPCDNPRQAWFARIHVTPNTKLVNGEPERAA